MKAWLLVALLLPATGLAQARPAGPDTTAIQAKMFPNRKANPVAMGALPKATSAEGWWTVQKPEGQPYDAAALRGAKALNLDPAYVQGIRDGLQLVYQRNYDGARAYFHGLDNRFPGTGIASAVDAVVWQAAMLENWDFRYEPQYDKANTKAQAQIQAALKKDPNSAWEHFLLAGMQGIEAIQTTRHGHYLSALQLALDAMSEAGRAETLAPDFTDLRLADGMYNYWRTVVTQANRFLPDFGDNRKEGLAQMEQVEQQGVFLGPPATLALSLSFIEEGDIGLAMRECHRNQKVYPDNVINLLVLGQVQNMAHRYDDALTTWDHIQKVDPSNERVLYWRGVTLIHSGRSAQAIAPLRAYLGASYLDSNYRAWTEFRLGQAYYSQKRYPEARAAYLAAVKADSHTPAKHALDYMARMKEQGRISY